MEGLFKSVLRLVAALALALGAGTAAHAAIPVTTCIAPLKTGAVEAERLISQPPLFDCTTAQTAFGPGDHAVQLQFAPVRSAPGDPLVLRISSVWQDSTRIVFRYADGTTAALQYTSGEASRYLALGALFEFPVPAHAAPLTGVFMEVRGSANLRGVVLGATLLPQSENLAVKDRLIALYALFVGLSLALIAYNAALWMVLRHRFQLAYCVMVVALLGYTFTSSGAVMAVFPGLDNNARLQCNYVLLVCAAVAGMNFIRHFFGLAVTGAALSRAITVASGVALLAALAFAVLAPWQIHLLDRLFLCAGIALMSLVGPVVWRAWRLRSRYLALFVLAWSPPIVATALRFANGFDMVPYSFWLDNGNVLALMLESLLSTPLIVTRLRELSQDRDSARAGERTALRLANSDPLTGLLNRRAFLDLAIGRSAMHRLLLIDIDRFKAINDRLGHDAGDEVLCEIARVIQRLRPPGSLAVRLGGEEFALLVPLGRQEECAPDLILDAVRQQAMPLGLQVTISLGFADGRVSTHEGWKRLYRLADAALYRAKADGRDRACRATDFTSIAAA